MDSKFNFKNPKDIEKLVESINIIKDNPLFSDLFNLVFSGIDLADLFDTLKKAAEEQKEPEHVLPSSKVSQNIGLNIHKLVGSYIDEEVTPFTDMGDDDKNNLYAHLYEFGCWIYNKNIESE